MTRPAPLRLGVLISGAGTNLNAILVEAETGALNAEVRVVISNRADAPGCAFGRDRGIPTLVMTRADFPNRAAQQESMADTLVEHDVELVVLAGFNQILNPEFVHRFSWRMINLHPSLLPAFGAGMHGVRDALEWGAKVSGCTVHFIADEFQATDSGPVILQEAVPIEEDDTEESLLARVQQAEYRALPRAIQLFAENRLQIEGRRVHVLPADGELRR